MSDFAKILSTIDGEERKNSGFKFLSLLWCRYMLVIATVFSLVFSVVALYPGALSPDSVTSFYEAKFSNYGLWHPAAYALIWKLVLLVTAGQAGMLYLNQILYWGSLGWLAWLQSKLGFRARAWAVLAVGWLPPFFMHFGIIWKDISLSAFFLASFALLYTGRQKNKVVCIWGSIILVMIGVLFRYNSALAATPLLVTGLHYSKILPGKQRDFWQKHFIVFGTVVVLFLMAYSAIFNWMMVSSDKKVRHIQEIVLYDLVGISIKSGESVVPVSIEPHRLDQLVHIYTPASTVPLYWSDDYPPRMIDPQRGTSDFRPAGANIRFPETLTDLQLKESQAAWRKHVVEKFSAYLSHRWQVFSYLLGVGNASSCYPYHDVVFSNARPENSELKEFDRSQHWRFKLNRAVTEVAYETSNWFYFRPWVYLLLMLVLPRCLKNLRARSPEIYALRASSLLYVASYFPIGLSCDFRYLVWSCLAAILSLLVVQSQKN